MHGMGMGIIPVLLHRMDLVCGLVTGQVPVGVRSMLPVKDIDMVLGNDLARSRVWVDVPITALT